MEINYLFVRNCMFDFKKFFVFYKLWVTKRESDCVYVDVIDLLNIFIFINYILRLVDLIERVN